MNSEVSSESAWTYFLESQRYRIIVRDDQLSWPEAMELARERSKQKRKLVLLDTGNFSLSELEWIASFGATIVSYLEARRTRSDMLLLQKVASRHRGRIIFACAASFKKHEAVTEILDSLHQMGWGGVDLHLLGQRDSFSPEELTALATDCRKGKAWMVYYHHGAFEPWLVHLAREGVWLHLSDKFYHHDHFNNLEEIIHAYAGRHVRLVLHQEEEVFTELAETVTSLGGWVIFRLSRPELAKKKGRYQVLKEKRLPFRAYHLNPRVMT